MKKAKTLKLNEVVPRCPLCYDDMGRGVDLRRGLFLYECKRDRIAIRIDDPFVGRWEEALHNATNGEGIPCPQPSCGGKMRYFATQRGYMKAVCPKKSCGASVTTGEPERPAGDWTTPDKPGVVQ